LILLLFSALLYHILRLPTGSDFNLAELTLFETDGASASSGGGGNEYGLQETLSSLRSTSVENGRRYLIRDRTDGSTPLPLVVLYL
jgi:hypothetical protein